MMKQQSGVELSDEEIRNFKNMVTPEMMNMVKDMDPNYVAF